MQLVDKTEEVVFARRISTVRDMNTRLFDAATVHDAGHQIGQAFSSNPIDVPYWMIYIYDHSRKHVQKHNRPNKKLMEKKIA